MTVSPILSADFVLQLHMAAGVAALLIGAINLVRRKGTRSHRWRGVVWVVLVALTAGSSFWIHEWRTLGRWSLLHALAVVVLLALPMAVRKAQRGEIAAHRRGMIGIFLGGLVTAAIVSLTTGPMMQQVFSGS